MRAKSAAVLTLATLLLVTSAPPALAVPVLESRTVYRTSGAEYFLEHLEKVEVDAGGADLIMEVGGEKRAVRIEVDQSMEAIRLALADGETDLVDLAFLPVALGMLLRFSGFLLRLGKTT